MKTRMVLVGAAALVAAGWMGCSGTSSDAGGEAGATGGSGGTKADASVGETGGSAGSAAGGGTAGAAGGTSACGAVGENCCSGTTCDSGLTCQAGKCAQVAEGETGKTCTKNSECGSGICLPVGGKNVCTTSCGAGKTCVAGWDCKALLGQSSDVCQCSMVAESCDGKDNDCDGIVDNQVAADQGCKAAKGASYVCKSGACACGSMCGSTCADLKTDANNCGTCGNKCASPTNACVGGQCACPGGAVLCSGSCMLDDVNNCGTCGNKCSSATNTCVNQTCVYACANGRYLVLDAGSGLCDKYDGTGLVKDTKPGGLTWMRQSYDPSTGQNQAQADAYCKTKSMRLPTKDEALAIAGTNYDTCAFPCHWGTWTSTSAGSGSAWSVFYDGYAYESAVGNDVSFSLVLCVR